MDDDRKKVKCPRCGGFSRPIVCILCDHEYEKDPGQHGYVRKELAAAYILLKPEHGILSIDEIKKLVKAINRDEKK